MIKVIKNEKIGVIRVKVWGKNNFAFFDEDIAKAVGYKNTSVALRDVSFEDKILSQIKASSGKQNMYLLNTKGASIVIKKALKSKKISEEKAELFLNWLDEEIKGVI